MSSLQYVEDLFPDTLFAQSRINIYSIIVIKFTWFRYTDNVLLSTIIWGT